MITINRHIDNKDNKYFLFLLKTPTKSIQAVLCDFIDIKQKIIETYFSMVDNLLHIVPIVFLSHVSNMFSLGTQLESVSKTQVFQYNMYKVNMNLACTLNTIDYT